MLAVRRVCVVVLVFGREGECVCVFVCVCVCVRERKGHIAVPFGYAESDYNPRAPRL